MRSSQVGSAPSARTSVLAVAGGVVALCLAVHHLWPAALSLRVGDEPARLEDHLAPDERGA
ncbi:hypothetical protein [Sorangium sp. So ce426]|uniref:hypothetical protein n=1 Tax=unclassified Sorangium TaxID=2621164 RepID=UPI003F5B2188